MASKSIIKPTITIRYPKPKSSVQKVLQIGSGRFIASDEDMAQYLDVGHKVNGRLRNDGTFEAASWKLKDYYTGEPHQHKSRKQEQEVEEQERKETWHYLGWDLGAMLKK